MRKPRNWIPLQYFIDRYGFAMGIEKFMEYVKYLDNKGREGK